MYAHTYTHNILQLTKRISQTYKLQQQQQQQNSKWESPNCNSITILQLEVSYKHINESLYNSTDDSHWAMDMVWELSGLFSPILSTLEHRPSCRIVAPLYRRRVSHLLLHTFHRQLQNTCKWLIHTAKTSFFKTHTNKHNMVTSDLYFITNWSICELSAANFSLNLLETIISAASSTKRL
jgi:hypothetical protein